MMKKGIFVLGLLIMMATGSVIFAQEAAVTVAGQDDGPVIALDKTTHDFGEIPYGSDGTCYFTVTNNGNSPLIISDCKKSCGCTVPTCTKDPIPPGGMTKIKIKYDTKRPGKFDKTVTVSSNAANKKTVIVRIKGTVGQKPVEPTNTTPKVN